MKEEIDNQNKDESVSEIMRGDTSEVLQKMEQQMPIIFQNYSNLYTQYLHMLDDIFGTFFISEKKLFENLEIEPKTMKQIKENSKSIKNMYIQNIENSSKLFEGFSKMKIKSMKSYDNYVHDMMTFYFNYLSQCKKPDRVKN